MLEEPDIPRKDIQTCLQVEFRLKIRPPRFLPWGADVNTAVYRVDEEGGAAFFLKLRRGEFLPASVAVPNILFDQGLHEVIPALRTCAGRLWGQIGAYSAILYPFLEGKNGFERDLSDEQRVAFGAALKRLHVTQFPTESTRGVPREEFSPFWRERVKFFLEQGSDLRYTDLVAAEMAAFLREKRAETLALVDRAEEYSLRLQSKPRKNCLCHGDIHAWNLLITLDERLYLVDWDTLIFAPKERDLMFVGSGLGGRGHSLEDEERLFYLGYGPTEVDPVALSYYRYERIIEDIAAFCEQVLLSAEGGEDRQQALKYLRSNYLPEGTLALARRGDPGG